MLRNWWGKGKPRFFVSLAVQVAEGAEDLHEGVGWFRRRGNAPEGMPAAPDAKTWLGLYRDHGRVMDTVFSWAFGDKLQGAQASTLASLWRGFVRDFAAASKADQAAVVGLVPAEALGEYASMFAPVEFPPSEGVLRKMLEGRPLKLGESRDEDDAVTGRLVALPEVEFLLRVVLPCAVLYQQCPAKLFHRARAGRKGDDLEDLVDLLRLDKSVLGDKLILQRWHDVMHGPNKGRQSVLLRRCAERQGDHRRGRRARNWRRGSSHNWGSHSGVRLRRRRSGNCSTGSRGLERGTWTRICRLRRH